MLSDSAAAAATYPLGSEAWLLPRHTEQMNAPHWTVKGSVIANSSRVA